MALFRFPSRRSDLICASCQHAGSQRLGWHAPNPPRARGPPRAWEPAVTFKAVPPRLGCMHEPRAPRRPHAAAQQGGRQPRVGAGGLQKSDPTRLWSEKSSVPRGRPGLESSLWSQEQRVTGLDAPAFFQRCGDTDGPFRW